MNIKCNCDDIRAFYCDIHEYEKKTLGKARTFKTPPIHETVVVDDLNNGVVGERLVKLKANITPAERRMWDVLVDMQIDFLYQCVIYPYYGDFLLWEYGVILELDGSSHFNRDEHDDRRSAYIENLGLQVRRISNSDVSIETVAEHLKDIPLVKKDTIKKLIDDHNRSKIIL